MYKESLLTRGNTTRFVDLHMLKVSSRFAACVAVVAFFAGAASASAQDKLDRALRDGKRSGQPQRVILTARPGYSGWLRQSLLNNGQHVDADLPSVGALATELTPQQLDAYCGSSMVDRCSVDGEVTAHATPARLRASRYSAPAVNTMLGTLGLVPSTAGGLGVTVALIDSGLFPSDAFRGRIKAFYDFTDGKQQLKRYASDDYGHGTHVAGLIGASESRLDHMFQGVAPGVEFVVLKVLDAQGKGKTSDVMRAIAFAAANTDRSGSPLGIDIINLSLGHPIFEAAATDPLVQAVDAATRMGAIVVASAGNFGVNRETGEIGYAGITSPGNARSAITVGAFDHKATVSRGDDRVTAYSSRGPTWYDGYAKPDVVAPGHYLTSEASPWSGLFVGYPSLRKKGPSGKALLTLSGTSMSAAVTTGVVALLKAQQPMLTANLAKAVLQFTAIPLSDDAGQPYNVLTQGAGGINASGAMRLLASIDPSLGQGQPTPAIWTDLQCDRDQNHQVSGGDCSTILEGHPYLWAGNIVWGDNVVWGDSIRYNLPIWDLNIVWGENVVWGDSFDGDNIVWGDNVVWGDNIVWGDGLVSRADDADNVVWGNLFDDNVVWGNAALTIGKGGR